MEGEGLPGAVPPVDDGRRSKREIQINGKGASGASGDRDLASKPTLKEQRESAKKAMLTRMDLSEVLALSLHIGEPDGKELTADMIKNESEKYKKYADNLEFKIRDSTFSPSQSKFESDDEMRIKEYIVNVIIESVTPESLQQYQKVAEGIGKKTRFLDNYEKVILNQPDKGESKQKIEKRNEELKFNEKHFKRIDRFYNKHKIPTYLQTGKGLEEKDVKLSLKNFKELRNIFGEAKSKKSHYETAKDLTRSKANKMLRSFAKNVAKIGSNVRKNVVGAVERVLNRKKGKGVGGPGGGL